MEEIELGPGACEYTGPRRVVITADSDGGIHKDRTRVFIADDKGQLREWRLRYVIPHAGAVQCNLVSPDDHDHGMTMFVLPDGSLSFNGGTYRPIPGITEKCIVVVPFA